MRATRELSLRTIRIRLLPAKNTHRLFLSAFPMFIPSLAWQNDAFSA
jgi:hypothetical protein